MRGNVVHTQQVADQQIALYGEPWAGRIRRLLDGYRIPQSRLAGVVGLSAPMLSQLINVQRVKISNPTVFARIVRLEEIANQHAGDPAALAAGLDEVAASTPVLSTVRSGLHGAESGGREAAASHLAGYSGHALAAAAAAAEAAGDRQLAGVLREAGGRAVGPRDSSHVP